MGLHNPLPMRAWIRRCLLLSYRVPESVAVAFVPPGLELITKGGFAFLNVVLARMEAMRPAGLPAWIGVDYGHVGYRLQVRCHTREGEHEGLYFLRSECDHRLLGFAGNLLTDFRFHPARIEGLEAGKTLCVHSLDGGGEVILDPQGAVGLAPGSPFSDLDEASRILRYNPLGLAPAGPNRVVLLDIAHGPWSLRSVALAHQRFSFIETLPGVAFELAFELAPIEYHFQRGRVVALR